MHQLTLHGMADSLDCYVHAVFQWHFASVWFQSSNVSMAELVMYIQGYASSWTLLQLYQSNSKVKLTTALNALQSEI
jgi:hypothetical protein